MGYARRDTFGKCDCRPREFQSNKFPPNSFVCNNKCIYSIFCNMELNKISIGDRIKKLRISFQKPYYFLSMMNNGDIMIVFENDEGQRVSFRGKSILESVERAENYLKSVSFKPSEKYSPEEEKDESVTVKTKIKDDKGNEIVEE
jgi:hypothetical protein